MQLCFACGLQRAQLFNHSYVSLLVVNKLPFKFSRRFENSRSVLTCFYFSRKKIVVLCNTFSLQVEFVLYNKFLIWESVAKSSSLETTFALWRHSKLCYVSRVQVTHERAQNVVCSNNTRNIRQSNFCSVKLTYVRLLFWTLNAEAHPLVFINLACTYFDNNFSLT